MKAKKSLGQNFLKSERALAKIVEVGDLKPGEQVLEIGPGKGALTEKLLATSCKLIAVEKDDELYEFLKTKFNNEIESGQLTLIHDDILHLELKSYKLEANNYKLIANIPYNLTGLIIRKFLSDESQPQKMVLLLQREVVQRIVAREGKESLLSLSVKAYGEPRYVETVKAGSFAPAPKVDSAIVEISDISKKLFDTKNGGLDEERFFELIRVGFSSKRKKLLSNLAKITSKEGLARAFERVGLSENARAEDLSLENWVKLAKNL